MRTRRQARAEARTSLRSSQQVAAGQWIRVAIPGEPFPVYMRVGSMPEAPAFIDHDPDGKGGYTAVAALRAPALSLGVHPVTVRLPDGLFIETAITII